MKLVAFDLGGVLRKIYCHLSKEEETRDYASIIDMYRLFVNSPDWEVAITTQRPKDRCTKKSVIEELDKHKIPHPDMIIITEDSKLNIYKSFKPQLVFDDKDKYIEEAKKAGATTFKVW